MTISNLLSMGVCNSLEVLPVTFKTQQIQEISKERLQQQFENRFHFLCSKLYSFAITVVLLSVVIYVEDLYTDSKVFEELIFLPSFYYRFQTKANDLTDLKDEFVVPTSRYVFNFTDLS